MGGVKEISIFVDESGSFVPESEDKASRHYLLCMVFHDQADDISSEVARLEESLELLGVGRDHCLHAGPLIRREQDYANMTREERRALMRRMFIFFEKAPVTYRSFRIDKHFNTANMAIHDTLLQEIVSFLVEQRDSFNAYDRLKIYYDYGQEQVTALLREAFAIFSSKVEWVENVAPDKYRLFQAADLACTLELVRAKIEDEGWISNSEYAFFGGVSRLEKLYLKPLLKKRV